MLTLRILTVFMLSHLHFLYYFIAEELGKPRHKHTDTHTSTLTPKQHLPPHFQHSKLESRCIPSWGCYMHHLASRFLKNCQR